MSETKHTPGPWKYRDVPGAGLEIYAKMTNFPEFKQPISFFHMPSNKDIRFQLNDKGELWGTIAYEAWRQFPDKKWDNVQTANAQLIAAAPETKKQRDALLEACEKYHKALQNQNSDAGPELMSILKEELHEADRIGEAAISAAGG